MSIVGSAWDWIREGGNANVVLVGVTSIYVFLTWRIMGATRRQAAAMVQPVLSLRGFVTKTEDVADENNVLVKNLGSQPVVFLGVDVSCLPLGRKAIVRSGWYEDTVLSAGAEFVISHNFKKDLAAIGVSEDWCGYQVLMVVSDLSRTVVAEYEYLPGAGQVRCVLGYPLSVRWRNFRKRWRWKYFRAEPVLKDLKRWGEWENV